MENYALHDEFYDEDADKTLLQLLEDSFDPNEVLPSNPPPLPKRPEMFSVDRFYYLLKVNLKGSRTQMMLI